MKTVLFFSGIVLFIAGCRDELTQTPPAGSVREVYGIIIHKAVSAGEKIDLSVECVVPDPCYGFSHMETLIVKGKIYLTIYTGPMTMDPCVQILGTFKKDISITVPAPGDYTLHYRSNYDEMRDTVLTVL